MGINIPPAIKFQIKPDIHEMIPIVPITYIVILCMNQMIGPPIKFQMTPNIDEMIPIMHITYIVIVCMCHTISINIFPFN
jgi:hypothetical protein